MNNDKKPSIRFKGFTDNWELYRALNIFESYINKNCLNLPILSATQEFGMINRNETGIYISHDKKNEITYKHVLPGQFVIHLRSFQGGFAHSAIEGITSPAYTVFDFKEVDKHYDYFWKYIFNSEKFIKCLEMVTYGIRDGRSINYNEFLMMIFCYPNYKEQKKIGTFFKRFDSLINLYQQKCEKLKNIKKAMLEKMFPKDDSNIPEIRFEGFTDAWKQCQLKEIVNYISSSLSAKDITNDGKYKLFDANDIIGYTNTKPIREKYITIIKDGSGVGRTKLLSENTIFISTMGGILAKDNTDINFLFCCMKKIDFNNYINGATIPHIYFSNYGSALIYVTSLNEQKKIGIFFERLDFLINLYQQKCQKLKNIKKAMLEKMFI